MDPHTWFRDLIAIVQVVIVPALGYIGYTMHEIRADMASMAGRISRLEEWKNGREKHWEEHDVRYASDVAETWKAIDAIRERCLRHLTGKGMGSE